MTVGILQGVAGHDGGGGGHTRPAAVDLARNSIELWRMRQSVGSRDQHPVRQRHQ